MICDNCQAEVDDLHTAHTVAHRLDQQDRPPQNRTHRSSRKRIADRFAGRRLLFCSIAIAFGVLGWR